MGVLTKIKFSNQFCNMSKALTSLPEKDIMLNNMAFKSNKMKVVRLKPILRPSESKKSKSIKNYKSFVNLIKSFNQELQTLRFLNV